MTVDGIIIMVMMWSMCPLSDPDTMSLTGHTRHAIAQQLMAQSANTVELLWHIEQPSFTQIVFDSGPHPAVIKVPYRPCPGTLYVVMHEGPLYSHTSRGGEPGGISEYMTFSIIESRLYCLCRRRNRTTTPVIIK